MKQLIVLLYFCVLFSSCVSTRFDFKEYNKYKVEKIDSTGFMEYNYMYLTNSNHEYFWLLSNKLVNKDSVFNHKNNFRKIERNDIVNVQLIKIDTIKS